MLYACFSAAKLFSEVKLDDWEEVPGLSVKGSSDLYEVVLYLW